MEENGNGTITRYIRGLGIISSDSEEAKTYYHYVSDEQGSITHVLSEDAENRFCYNGEMLDPVTQQDNYYGDGLNLYQYCQANPVGYVDPSGHSVCPVLKSKEEYRKQHPEATAAEAYEAVTGKDPLKKKDSSSLQAVADKVAQEYYAKYNPYERAVSKGYTNAKKTACVASFG